MCTSNTDSTRELMYIQIYETMIKVNLMFAKGIDFTRC